MTTPTFTNPPTAPARSQAPATYVANFNAWIAWHTNHFVSEIAAGVSWIADQVTAILGYTTTASAAATTASAAAVAATSVSTLFDTSASSLSPSAGAKSVAYDNAGRTFANGDDIYLIRRSDPTVRMHGAASSVNNTAKTMTVTVGSTGFIGTGGPYTDWMVIHGDLVSLAAAVAGDVLAASNVLAAVTPKALKDALAPYALSDATTVTPSGLNGLDFTWTIGGNRTLANITNTYPGATGSILITQDVTGTRLLAWGNAYRRRGGLPVLSTAAGTVDELEYKVRSVDGSNTATRISVSFSKAPSN